MLEVRTNNMDSIWAKDHQSVYSLMIRPGERPHGCFTTRYSARKYDSLKAFRTATHARRSFASTQPFAKATMILGISSEDSAGTALCVNSPVVDVACDPTSSSMEPFRTPGHVSAKRRSIDTDHSVCCHGRDFAELVTIR
jgi:hypothetical protein